jgi:16S rRNA (cytosine1402-N4)-methyltransferase
MLHTPVLLSQSLALLDPQPGETALDCTAGLGGHAAAMAERIGPAGTIVLFDLDPGNLDAARRRVEGLERAPKVFAIHGSYSEAPRRMVELGLSADVVLADLGFASSQVDDPARGFSFSRDGPLDMRMDPTSPITAAELVNTLPERELAELIRDFGEETQAGGIAKKLVEERRTEPIQTTARLAAIVRRAAGSKVGSSIDPATRTFQALRIAVNDELGRLAMLLEAIERGAVAAVRAGHGGNSFSPGRWLRSGARVAVISFHSLEDRPVKRAFASMVAKKTAVALTKKPIEAEEEEVRANPRARSAKLRAVRLTEEARR